MSLFQHVRRMMQPLRSRKVRVAIATLVGAFAAEYGLHVREELVLTILSVGVALILGIAHEDAGRRRGGGSSVPAGQQRRLDHPT